MNRVRLFAWIGLGGALWALSFAAVSSLDYASHLDRGLHDLHCSFIPGAAVSDEAVGCRVALNSPYAAFFKDRYWGGIPISLLGVGCFAYLIGHALYLALRANKVTRPAGLLYFLLAMSPALVSLGMFGLSWFVLGTVCKTCLGIYIGSAILLVSAVGVLTQTWSERESPSHGGLLWAGAALAALGLWTAVPSAVYAAMLPDHSPYINQCGTLRTPKEANGALLQIKGANAKTDAVFFEDPLCPTCKSLHDRLVHAQAMDKLAIELSLFPLDNECNWMLDTALHPGACEVARAVICAENPGELLNWAYENQDKLTAAGKTSKAAVAEVVGARWGKGLVACMHAKTTTQRLNRQLHFAVENGIAVSTPQVFISGQRLCDEDIDIGLLFALNKLAPGLIQ